MIAHSSSSVLWRNEGHGIGGAGGTGGGGGGSPPRGEEGVFPPGGVSRVVSEASDRRHKNYGGRHKECQPIRPGPQRRPGKPLHRPPFLSAHSETSRSRRCCMPHPGGLASRSPADLTSPAAGPCAFKRFY